MTKKTAKGIATLLVFKTSDLKPQNIMRYAHKSNFENASIVKQRRTTILEK